MKIVARTLLLLAVGLFVISGCSVIENSTSSVVRTCGVGEEALPLERGQLAVEVSNLKVEIMDKIEYLEYELLSNPGESMVQVYEMSLGETSTITDNKLRLGLSIRDELALSYLHGAEGGTYEYTQTIDDITTRKSFKCYTKYRGFKVAYKRLLSDLDNPTKVSLFVSGAHISFDSNREAAAYDAKSYETKLAVLIGHHPNTERRTHYPTVAIYHSSAHTNRAKTIPGVAKKKHPQALGSELLYTVHYGILYSALSGGVEYQL